MIKTIKKLVKNKMYDIINNSRNMTIRSRNNSIDYKASTKNRGRTYSIEYKLSDRSKNSSEEDGVEYTINSRSSSGCSIGSWDSIYMSDDYELNELSDISDISVKSTNTAKCGRSLSFEYKITKIEPVEADMKNITRRKRDVYINDITASPRPSSFICYMTELMKNRQSK